MDSPPIIKTRQMRVGWWLTCGLSLAAAAAVLFLFNPSEHAFYPRCMLYATTGIYCPGCGSLRALHNLSHGHLLTALHYNPLLVLALPFAVFAGGRMLLREAAGKPAPSIQIRAGWIWLIAVTM